MPKEAPEIWSVSQLTRRVKNLLEADIGQAWVSGEISNWKVAASGHAYFTLKDESSQIDAVMFKGRLNRLRFEPESGLEVIAHGQVTVYERRGNYQIVLDDMQPKGVGALQLAFEKLKKKLQEEGLFDEEHKKPLPMLPRRVGVVTSPTGAAIRDILNVLGRRFAGLHVILYPARVQGEAAAAEIVEGIRALDNWGVDVMIVGRGGGSLEDLWPFNEESVVRAVFEAKTPVISAVGHEVDYALTDFAADLRAPTPSAAAELVVQEREGLVERVGALRSRMGGALGRQLERARYRLTVAQNSFVFTRPEELLRQRRQAADEWRLRLEALIASGLRETRNRVDRAKRGLALLSPSNRLREARERHAAVLRGLQRSGTAAVARFRARLLPVVAQLDALSPLAILSRGYSLVRKLPGMAVVHEAAQLAPGDEVSLRFGSGVATAEIQTVEEQDDGL
jgi:exodeoxyribonuclease VII large subunit